MLGNPRKSRGSTQNIFLIETLINDNNNNDNYNELKREYVVMGLTGNVYNVIIKKQCTCTCPDFVARRYKCKHIYFILLRVMKVDKNDEDKNSYTDDELLNMFNNINNNINNLMINIEKKLLYDNYKSNSINKNNEQIVQKNTDDLCPICLDDLENDEELEYCKYSCGKPIHKLCFSMWCKKNKATCIFCRNSWDKPNDSVYINLYKNI
jgi:hypothetical protein